MKTFVVSITQTLTYEIEVEADSEEAAEAKAWEKWEDSDDPTCSFPVDAGESQLESIVEIPA